MTAVEEADVVVLGTDGEEPVHRYDDSDDHLTHRRHGPTRAEDGYTCVLTAERPGDVLDKAWMRYLFSPRDEDTTKPHHDDRRRP